MQASKSIANQLLKSTRIRVATDMIYYLFIVCVTWIIQQGILIVKEETDVEIKNKTPLHSDMIATPKGSEYVYYTFYLNIIKDSKTLHAPYKSLLFSNQMYHL